MMHQLKFSDKSFPSKFFWSLATKPILIMGSEAPPKFPDEDVPMIAMSSKVNSKDDLKAASNDSDNSPKLKRELTLIDGASMIIGIIVGSGIFVRWVKVHLYCTHNRLFFLQPQGSVEVRGVGGARLRGVGAVRGSLLHRCPLLRGARDDDS